MRLDHRALEDVAALLREAAEREVMPRFRRLGPAGVRSKGSALDLVTDADEAAERAISAGLLERFPGAVVVGEEAASADPTLLGRLADAPLAFVVDPLDGTANFAAGLPLFGVICAALRAGEVVAGWLLDPVSGDMAMALRGEGAVSVSAEGERRDLRVAPAAGLESMLGAVAWGFMTPERRARVLPRLARLAGVQNLRCAAHEWRLAAAGHLHLLVYNRLLPWDHAAGWLLHREAGGYSARFDASPYTPLETGGGIVAVPRAEDWAAVMEGLGIAG
ncbi:MAG: inositol monophosphatase family protein [Rhodovarius sp.]|nr:inositol monophosphatase [Rhodovarius sp.]MCX7931985.1 inositol monophosphatase [Rhodovarius sp.]MDW8313948.1 inositol monophosphatase family protein [Rhodovarius sp.]